MCIRDSSHIEISPAHQKCPKNWLLLCLSGALGLLGSALTNYPCKLRLISFLRPRGCWCTHCTPGYAYGPNNSLYVVCAAIQKHPVIINWWWWWWWWCDDDDDDSSSFVLFSLLLIFLIIIIVSSMEFKSLSVANWSVSLSDRPTISTNVN